MKKLLIVLPVIVLMAAGCNSSQPSSYQNSSARQNPTTQNSTSTSTPSTPGSTSATNTTESYLQSLITKITNWNLYQQLANGNQYVGSDPCDGETDAQINSMNAYMDRVNTDKNVKSLTIDNSPDPYFGGKLAAYFTPNYQNWTAQEFIAYKGACSAGSPLTLFAYPDKVVWLDTCGGGVAPDDNNPNKQAIIEAENKCQSDRDLLVNYFQNLAQSKLK